MTTRIISGSQSPTQSISGFSLSAPQVTAFQSLTHLMPVLGASSPSLTGRVSADADSHTSKATKLQLVKIKILHELVEDGFSNLDKICDLLDEMFLLSGDDRATLVEVLNQIEKEFARGMTDHDTLLYRLIDNGHFKTAINLISVGISSIHSKNGCWERTPLHLAAEKGWIGGWRGRYKVVDCLIKHGANVNAVYEEGRNPNGDKDKIRTPLACCIAKGDTWDPADQERQRKIFKLLLKSGADPRIGTAIGFPIFNYCLRHRHDELALLVLDRSDINEADSVTEMTPLHIATALGRTDWMRVLIQRGAKVDTLGYAEGVLSSSRRISPLHSAVRNNQPGAVRLLLEAGASPNLKALNPLLNSHLFGDFGEGQPVTAFHMAVELSAEECTREIVQFAINNHIELDQEFPGVRNWMDGAFKKKGYVTADLRVKTEFAKAYPVQGLPKQLRIYCRAENYHEAIRATFTQLMQKKLGAATKMCAPLIDFLFKTLERENDLGIFCHFPEEMQGMGGCYNPDTGHELVLVLESVCAWDLIPVIMHESAHLAAHKKYHDYTCAPKDVPVGGPPKGKVVDLEDFAERASDSNFTKALKRDLKKLAESNWADCHETIRDVFQRVPRLYTQPHHEGEYLARIPQTAARIALLNPDMTEAELEAIFMKSIPNLYQYYMRQFLPDCRE